MLLTDYPSYNQSYGHIFRPLFEQRAFTPAAIFVVDIAKRCAGAAKSDAVLGFIVFFIGIEPSVAAQAVACLPVIEYGVVILGGHPVHFAVILPYYYNVFRVFFHRISVIGRVSFAPFNIYLLVNHNTVPCAAALPADNRKQRDQKEHAADAKPYIQRLRIIHLSSAFSVNSKAYDSGGRQNDREYGRPAVCFFYIFCKSRITDLF